MIGYLRSDERRLEHLDVRRVELLDVEARDLCRQRRPKARKFAQYVVVLSIGVGPFSKFDHNGPKPVSHLRAHTLDIRETSDAGLDGVNDEPLNVAWGCAGQYRNHGECRERQARILRLRYCAKRLQAKCDHG